MPNSPPTHSAAKQKKYNQRLEKSRPNAHRRGYEMYLAEHPLCVVCGGPANVVDHIIPHKGNRHLFSDLPDDEPDTSIEIPEYRSEIRGIPSGLNPDEVEGAPV